MELTEKELIKLEKEYQCPKCKGKIFFANSSFNPVFFCNTINCRTDGFLENLKQKDKRKK